MRLEWFVLQLCTGHAVSFFAHIFRSSQFRSIDSDNIAYTVLKAPFVILKALNHYQSTTPMLVLCGSCTHKHFYFLTVLPIKTWFPLSGLLLLFWLGRILDTCISPCLLRCSIPS
ncbi:hypothetical protein C8R48DRAFT_685957 [Suillus tomentosus]|nr:hypothetical protein C8R48DRAFT_685957 [Suillus tomentosus]